MQFEDWFFTHTNSSVEMMDDMHKAFLAGRASAIPDGYALVPVEPTRSMMASAVIQAEGNAVYKSVEARWLEGEETKYGDAYKAMIEAAQKEME